MSGIIGHLALVWKALNSEQPYRLAWPAEQALEYFHQSAHLFNPEALEMFFQEI